MHCGRRKEMIQRWKIGLGCALLTALVTGSSGHAQCISPTLEDPSPAQHNGKILVDRGTGQVWILSNKSRPRGLSPTQPQWDRVPGARVPDTMSAALESGRMIHAGDRLDLVDCRAGVETHLEATALRPASIGEQLDVRTRVFGAQLTVIAAARGQVLLVPAMGARP